MMPAHHSETGRHGLGRPPRTLWILDRSAFVGGKSSRPGRWLLLAGLACLVLWAPSLLQATTTQVESEDAYTIGLYQRLAPATVLLSSVYNSGHHLVAPTAMGVGAGFIIEPDGIVLTNAHVVEGASTITAILFDGRQIPAELIGSDPETDLAMLRLPVDKGPYATVPFGDSDRLQVGQRALVVGSPFGLGFTLTSGIVSSLGSLPSGTALIDSRVIQTTAPINPGNSGGPLVDAQGRVIGIATAVIVGAQNIGFAIPINTVKAVLVELKQRGHVARPWLGVKGKFPTAEVIRLFAVPLTQGLLVEDLEDGGPAAEAGLRAGSTEVMVNGMPWILGGDIIVAITGRPVHTLDTFREALRNLPVGRPVEVEFLRDGARRRTALIVRERPAGSSKTTGSSSGPIAGRHPRASPPPGSIGTAAF